MKEKKKLWKCVSTVQVAYSLNIYPHLATGRNNAKNALLCNTCNTLFKNKNNQCVSQILIFVKNLKDFFSFSLYGCFEENLDSTI